MANDLYELRDELKECKRISDYVNFLMDQYAAATTNGMKMNQMFYILGSLDALRWSGKISQEDYTELYKHFGQ